MTTHASPAAGLRDSRTPTWPVLAAVGIAWSVLLTAVGTYVDFNGNDTGHRGDLAEMLVVVAMIGAAAGIVYGLVVRTSTAQNAGRRGLVLAVLSLLTGLVFWTGVPCVLASGAIACALTGRESTGRFTNAGKAILGMSSVAIALASLMAIVG